jgi:hypothetical protein
MYMCMKLKLALSYSVFGIKETSNQIIRHALRGKNPTTQIHVSKSSPYTIL